MINKMTIKDIKKENIKNIILNVANIYNCEKSNFKLKINDELIPIISKEYTIIVLN